MAETFLYAVHPKRIITGLSSGRCVRVAQSIQLTKDDVYACLKKAAVYRRFPLDGNIRVTVSNVDRLHRNEFISEEQWKKMQDGTEVKDETIPVTQETKSDEVVDPTPIVEEPDNQKTDSLITDTSEEEEHLNEDVEVEEVNIESNSEQENISEVVEPEQVTELNSDESAEEAENDNVESEIDEETSNEGRFTSTAFAQEQPVDNVTENDAEQKVEVSENSTATKVESKPREIKVQNYSNNNGYNKKHNRH